MGERQTEQSSSAHGSNDKTNRHDEPAIVPVGNRTGNEDQKQRWQKLKKTDQTEVKGISRHLIHLPAN